MLIQPYHLYIERTNAAKNMARYYALEISTTLFGHTCLTRRWGRIGFSGQTMAHHFDDENDAVRLFLSLTRQKRAKGYRPSPPRGRALS
jgi:predicted DNA-binding WGR domain protein